MPVTIIPPLPSHSHPLDQQPAFSANRRHSTAVTGPGSQAYPQARAKSPVAPEFSPITPKFLPALPALPTTVAHLSSTESPRVVDTSTHAAQQDGAAGRPTQHVPEPALQPFSSDDSTDGLALRAAIYSLQFQKRKAQDDMKALEQLKNLALADPERFTQDLLAGKLKEKRQRFGSLEELLDVVEDNDEEDGQASTTYDAAMGDERELAEVPSSQSTASPIFPPIPGPQDVVRMPHINWNKYHIVGEPLDALHEQQRRWPGAAPFQQNRGRDFAVAAPYSPFYDSFDGHQRHQRNISDGSRKDSVTPSTAVGTPTVIDHPYETRRSSKNTTQK